MNSQLPEILVIVLPAGVLVALMTHIFIMARWSGKVDANLTQIMGQPAQWTSDLNAVAVTLRLEIAKQDAEIVALRTARHSADGDIQRHEGALREIGRRLDVYATQIGSKG